MLSTEASSSDLSRRGNSPRKRPSSAAQPTRTGLGGRDRLVTALGVAPAALLIIIFVVWAAGRAVQLSFSKWGGLGDPEFVGLDNYQAALADDQLGHSVWVTAEVAILTTAGILVLATLLAASVSNGAKGRAFYRVVWFLPGIAPLSATGIFWSVAMAPESGAVNTVLGAIGLGSDHGWLADPDTAVYPTVAIAIWAGVGFAFLLILGATERIPVSLYEAARLDGAGAARQFFSLTLPLIRPVLAMTGLLEFIWAANGFTVIWAVTRGGPASATTTIPLMVYKQAFEFGNYGLANALAVLSAMVLLPIGFISLRLSAKESALS